MNQAEKNKFLYAESKGIDFWSINTNSILEY